MKEELNKDFLDPIDVQKIEHSEQNFNELSDDIEVVGPGQMLSEARIKLSLSQEDVAKKLNFCTALIIAIEQDSYDQNLPATFNRGYVRNYAKLVGINSEDIIASYESLGAAEIQRTELQSFSNNTAKQAEHSRLMWISYLIIVILLASTVLWWVQGERESKKEVSPEITSNQTSDVVASLAVEQEHSRLEKLQSEEATTSIENVNNNEMNDASSNVASQDILSNNIELNSPKVSMIDTTSEIEEVSLDRAVFTFSGDCWVNIYDANNERVAWGIKKQGYVMSIEGKSPFRVTIGKPELVSIAFNDENVDMTQYLSGNIAKFTLPVIIEE